MAVPVRVDAQPAAIEGGDMELEAMSVARALRKPSVNRLFSL